MTLLRAALHRLRLPYALGISSTLNVFVHRPRLVVPIPREGRGGPRTARRVAETDRPLVVRELAPGLPRSAWRWIRWRNGTQPSRRARFAALRVTPETGWRVGRLAPEVWLLCEREPDGDLNYYLVHLAPGTGLRRLVELAHQRWAIEQQYQELKSELGLDHFEGRGLPGGLGGVRSMRRTKRHDSQHTEALTLKPSYAQEQRRRYSKLERWASRSGSQLAK